MKCLAPSWRTDFPQRYRAPARKGAPVEHDVLVHEIAIGLDRCVYNWTIAAGR
ncbi:hypothetical protein GCM10007874_56180 [Labrys miyagiensis]|uniref:Transposase n=1 Tax=Labrys miyagiensis TaxID=346912 RepID=A0ABQ6CS38_9HYPH|nr:hypothetical protein [Labrys miyagiensis]GLS22598.1 hypothetical protein GCM10007874_56180 [Labrys miyagiensis]